jgi:hypothetical protein
MSLGTGRCYEHPDRAGLGICVECRRVICSECTTQFEGVNRCASCLQARLARARGLPPREDWSVPGVLQALAATASVWAGLWWVARLLAGR